MTADSVFISTSIPYVNGAPHVGFAWELVLADVLARHQRLTGADVLFLTGTDDNSLKNVRAAARAGQDTPGFVRRQGDRFVALARALGVSNDDLLRTAFDPRHAPAVARAWNAAAAAGDVSVRPYHGAYCVGCEQFYAPGELVDGRCPEHDEPLEEVEESNYFFRLSRHEPEIARAVLGGAVRVSPPVYGKEIERWFERGLEDFSISRSFARSAGWGIPVPGDPSQTVYVWFDALLNYVSALGYGSSGDALARYWQESRRRIHVIGKNLTRFHCIYWPGILQSAGLALPTDVVVHGFLTVEGRKIGKSLGNGVDPFELVERYGKDRLRYYLLRCFPLGRDGNFSAEALRVSADAELCDQLGNLLSRVLVLLEKYTGGLVPALDAERTPLADAALTTAVTAHAKLERAVPDQALGAILGFVGECNLALARTEPWKLGRALGATSDPARRSALERELGAVLGDSARALLWIAALLAPFLPDTSARIARAIGAPAPAVYRTPERTSWRELASGAHTARGDLLFPRLSSPGARVGHRAAAGP